MNGRPVVSAYATLVTVAFVSHPALAQRIGPDSQAAVRQHVQQVADSTRPDAAIGRTIKFNQLRITVLATTAASVGHMWHGTARLRLARGSDTDEITIGAPASINWHGYHVAIVEIHGNAPGGGLVALRLSMVAELPQCIGKSWKDPQSAPWPCYQKPDSARPGGKPRAQARDMVDCGSPSGECLVMSVSESGVARTVVRPTLKIYANTARATAPPTRKPRDLTESLR